MEKLRYGKWSENMATAQEFSEKVEDIKEMVKAHGWENRKVCPYGTWEKVSDLVAGWRNIRLDEYSPSSKRILIVEVNGLIEILNIWESESGKEK